MHPTIIPSFQYEIEQKNENNTQMHMNVSKFGGYPLWFLSNKQKNPTTSNISLEAAIKNALVFLEEMDFLHMKYISFSYGDNVVYTQFVATQDNVLLYPDMVTVKLSLFDSQILGFDALPYMRNHHERTWEKPQLSQEEAIKKISPSLKVEEIRLVVVKDQNEQEILCYECVATSQKQETFVVLVHAKNGQIEKITTQTHE